jgi:hypothetical protein
MSSLAIGNVINGNDYQVYGYTETSNGFSLNIHNNVTMADLAYIRIVFPTADVGDNPAISVNEPIKEKVAGFLADDVKVKVENVVGDVGGTTPDWNAAEGEAGHIKGRTHYKELVELLPENTHKVEDSMFFADCSFAFETGNTYQVMYNGTKYSCVSFSFTNDGGTFSVIGNGASLGLDDTGEPFCALIENGALAVFVMDEADEVTISISAYQYRKIPMPYMPNLVITVLNEHLLNDSSNIAEMQLDTTELVEALKNNIPVYLDITNIKGTSCRLSVVHWESFGYELDFYPVDKALISLYAWIMGLNKNICEPFTLQINMAD